MAAGATLIAPAGSVWAQAYPTKPVRWIVPYPPGGGSDFLARTVGAQLEKQMSQPIVVENRPGAATMIGAEAVARAPADGYTLLSGDNGTFVFNTALYKKVLKLVPDDDPAQMRLAEISTRLGLLKDAKNYYMAVGARRRARAAPRCRSPAHLRRS